MSLQSGSASDIAQKVSSHIADDYSAASMWLDRATSLLEAALHPYVFRRDNEHRPIEFEDLRTSISYKEMLRSSINPDLPENIRGVVYDFLLFLGSDVEMQEQQHGFLHMVLEPVLRDGEPLHQQYLAHQRALRLEHAVASTRVEQSYQKQRF